MQASNKGAYIGTVRSTSDSGRGFRAWWPPVESNCQESDSSKNSSFKMGVPAQRHHNVKWLDFSFQDQDSSSTQSTGQSYSGTADIGENAPDGQRMCFTQSEFFPFAISRGNSETDTYGSEPTLKQYPAQVAVPFTDQYFNTALSAYGPQAVVMGVMPGRLPLPLDFSTNEPVYVNAKQYHGILRRRQQRARLEAQNKLAKDRKPYLHESRHLHALKRARGSGGRFLNTKKLQELKPAPAAEGQNIRGSTSFHLAAGNSSESEVRRHETYSYRDGNSTSGSDVTSASTGDYIYHPPDFSFPSYSPCMGGAMQGGARGAGNYI
ncbi:hypothetical protein Cgig2_025166 [Carnegiea gigantea]|uniref:Nuclear transcription factor Y subunit n=1 Tax=Carnegiea gigantea TaxID=171969 RepID=A0A9Q1QN08_9CARY|nr:hypothetical protein Cgig2_025166 [Carnegiea gigantea]